MTLITLNLSITWCALCINLLLIFAGALSANLKQPVHRWFFRLLLINLFVVLTEVAVNLLEGHTDLASTIIIRIMDFLSYALAGVELWVAAEYLYHYMSTKTKVSKRIIYLSAVLVAGIVVLAAIAQFTHLYAWFDSNNMYHEQGTYWVSLVLPTIVLAVNVAFTVKHIRVLKTGEYISLLSYPILPVSCYIVEIMCPGIWLSHLASTLCLFLIYINIQIEVKNQLKEREIELAQERIAAMVNQMQPQFLYNTLNVIGERILDQPNVAREAVHTFSEYLSTNIASLSQKDLISFSHELMHVQQYSNLKEFCSQEPLKIVYDIQVDDFLLPALSLQPFVENAVGAITIKTEETKYVFRVTIADESTQVDQQQKYPEDEIKNVRNRLAAMCSGTLRIESTPGSGIVVFIEIPQKAS